MVSQWDSSAGEWSKDKYPAVFDKFDACIRPGIKQPDGSIKKSAYLGVGLVIMNKFSAHKDATFDFYSYMFTSDSYINNLAPNIDTYLLKCLNSDKIQRL